MTKVTILSQEPEQKKLKPIEFKFYLENDKTIKGPLDNPCQYEYIMLLEAEYTEDDLDLMYAYNLQRGKIKGVLYLGHYNDGVVE